MEPKVVELSSRLAKQVSEGERGFSIEIFKNTKETHILFQHLADKHAGVFDEHIFAHVKSALAEHEVELLLLIDDHAIGLYGTVLTKM
jgi:hypothetical protein